MSDPVDAQVRNGTYASRGRMRLVRSIGLLACASWMSCGDDSSRAPLDAAADAMDGASDAARFVRGFSNPKILDGGPDAEADSGDAGMRDSSDAADEDAPLRPTLPCPVLLSGTLRQLDGAQLAYAERQDTPRSVQGTAELNGPFALSSDNTMLAMSVIVARPNPMGLPELASTIRVVPWPSLAGGSRLFEPTTWVIRRLAFSPGGTHLAILASLGPLSEASLYVVELAHPGVVRLVSGGNPLARSADDFAWDPRAPAGTAWLAFSQQLFSGGLALYALDVAHETAPLTTIVSPPDTGAGNTLLPGPWGFDTDGRVLYRIRPAMSAVDEVWRSSLDGSDAAPLTALVPPVGERGLSVSAFGVSADGQWLAFAASAAAASPFQVYRLDLTREVAAEPVAIPEGEVAAQVGRGPEEGFPLVFSPDATLIAFLSDWAGSGSAAHAYGVYVAAAAGGAPPTRLLAAPGLNPSLDTRDVLSFCPTGGALWVRYRLASTDTVDLFALSDLLTRDQPALERKAISIAASGEVFGAVPLSTPVALP